MATCEVITIGKGEQAITVNKSDDDEGYPLNASLRAKVKKIKEDEQTAKTKAAKAAKTKAENAKKKAQEEKEKKAQEDK